MGMPGAFNWPGVSQVWSQPPPWMTADQQQAAAQLFESNAAAAVAPTTASQPDLQQQSAPEVAPAGKHQASPAKRPTCWLRLRGLPWDTTEQDIYSFFAKYDLVEMIAEGDAKAVKLLTKPNGKPSGQAEVQMVGSEEALLAKGAIHGQYMGRRYIEVIDVVEVPQPKQSQSHTESVENREDTGASTSGTTSLSEASGTCIGDTGGSEGASAPQVLPQTFQPWEQFAWSAMIAKGLSAPPYVPSPSMAQQEEMVKLGMPASMMLGGINFHLNSQDGLTSWGCSGGC